MFNRRTVPSAVFFAVLFATCVYGQRAELMNTRFVSPDGGFKIELPSEASHGVLPVGNLSNEAGSYTWKIPEGKITISFVEGIHGFNDGFEVVNDFGDSVTASLVKTEGKVMERTEFSFDGHPGLELRIKRNSGSSINRFILVGDRLYILTANFTRDDNDFRLLQILDTFQTMDHGSLIA
jgi:hypothetical protein